MIKKGYWYGFCFSVIVYAGRTLFGYGDISSIVITAPLVGLFITGPIGAVCGAIGALLGAIVRRMQPAAQQPETLLPETQQPETLPPG